MAVNVIVEPKTVKCILLNINYLIHHQTSKHIYTADSWVNRLEVQIILFSGYLKSKH